MRWRHPSQVVVNVVVLALVGVCALAAAFATFEGAVERIAALAVVAVYFTYAYQREMRPAIEVTATTLSVRNRGRPVVIPLEHLEAVRTEQGEGARPPRVFLDLTDGSTLPLIALQGGPVRTKGFRRWAGERVDELQSLIDSRRLSAR